MSYLSSCPYHSLSYSNTSLSPHEYRHQPLPPHVNNPYHLLPSRLSPFSITFFHITIHHRPSPSCRHSFSEATITGHPRSVTFTLGVTLGHSRSPDSRVNVQTHMKYPSSFVPPDRSTPADCRLIPLQLNKYSETLPPSSSFLLFLFFLFISKMQYV